MGNVLSGKQYIAKDSFQPDIDVFQDCVQEDDKVGGVTADMKSDQLKVEVALAITMQDKLKMVKEHTGLVGPGGTRLFKMRNLATKKEGLVLEDAVAKIGSVSCEE